MLLFAHSLALGLGLLPMLPPRAHDGEFHLPPQFELLEVPFSLWSPTCVIAAPDGTLLVAEKPGRVRALSRPDTISLPHGQLAPVLDLRDEVNGQGDRGLLSIAIAPDFVPDGGPTSWIYLAYTASPVFGEDLAFDEGNNYSHSMVTRYRIATEPNGDLLADVGSREVLLGERLPDGTAPDAIASLHESHANGSLVFAPDGTLLLATGDGAHFDAIDTGGLDDPGFDTYVHPETGLKGQLPKDQDSGSFRSRDLRSLAGKILRFDPETGLGLPSNPFFDGDASSIRSRIWATGLRNPFRMTLRPGTGVTDPSLAIPGQLIVGDVGSASWEELDVIDAPGLDFGWPCFEAYLDYPPLTDFVREGPNPFGYLDCTSDAPGPVRGPVLAWNHSVPEELVPSGVHVTETGDPAAGFTGSCVIGGAFYEGGAYPDDYDGEYFFADYGAGWIRTATLNPSGVVTQVRDFGDGLARPTSLAADPLTGDIYLTQLGGLGTTGKIFRLRHGPNLSPTAVLASNVETGPAPLEVQFDAISSTDPEAQPLTYRFDFGDGTILPDSPTAQASHTYSSPGIYTATLTVTDDVGLVDSDELDIVVGLSLPTVSIDSPFTGLLAPKGTVVELSGSGQNALGEPIELEWVIDLHHDEHVHPAWYTQTDTDTFSSSTTITVTDHGEAGEIDYYRVRLLGRDSNGLENVDEIWVYPAEQISDPSTAAFPVAKTFTLFPPGPMGAANDDPEVYRDGVQPEPGAFASSYFGTFHTQSDPDDDWFGYEFESPPASIARLIGLEFQAGDYVGGGWFDTLGVEVLTGDEWIPVQGLVCDPPYPEDPSQGAGYEHYTLHFDPVWGEGVRLRGDPGGQWNFLTCAELHVRMVDPATTLEGPEDLTDLGQLISLLLELGPPWTPGYGSLDPETVRNGTTPPVGSASLLAQVASQHVNHPGDTDWLGYSFDSARTLGLLEFQEGLTQSDGGWFESLGAEYRSTADGPWLPVPGLDVQPPFRSSGPSSLSYERFSLEFPPIVARAVRVVGPPGGTESYASYAELRVFGPYWDSEHCGHSTYGEQFAGNTAVLSSTTPPLPELPGRLEVENAIPASISVIAISAAAAELPLSTDTAILVDVSQAVTQPLAVDTDGRGSFDFALPASETLTGVTLFAQAASFDPFSSPPVRLSNGLRIEPCDG